MEQEDEMNQGDEKQCRICLDGVEAESELGRLIRPCLCKGSISYVHVKCLQRWRNTASGTAFFSCPQCHYRYRFSRTRVVGIATNPVIVGGISTIFFVLITFLSSFLTTYLLSFFQEPTSTTFYLSTGSFFYVSPLEVIHDLVRAALRILQDEDEALGVGLFSSPDRGARVPPPVDVDSGGGGGGGGSLRRFFIRFVIGLPLVGSVSLIQMLLTLPFIGPVHWLARYRGNRRRNNDTRDVTAIILVLLLVVGAARAFYRLYQVIQSWTTRALLKFEDSVLEVSA
ncbi:hypothetical protein E1B28_001004 [Marasmius oreades]|uniref:RING-CH-type domain-containing protein n=1 Tax=Marasmius oreades TaxID=181124 RepID=A0A9P8AEY4_9AGAR|nr:uncharacterized protein E1B28_001004 [Marasmius oreades]KAG7099132.1 hypothetical protein E1B28_001004 [Marasmius oreades]